MSYDRWMCGEDEWLNVRRSRRRSTPKGSQRAMKARELISIANNMYVRNELGKCIQILKEAICLCPKNPRPYFTLGLIFEEQKEYPKAYYCFLVAAHLQKNNYGLWRKLYEYSRRLGYEKERIYFIEVLQKKGNMREMVLEKMQLYGEDRFKELCCRIELFEFDGADDQIFELIKQSATHKAKLGRLAKKLQTYLLNAGSRCSDYYVIQLILLKYDALDTADMNMLFEKHVSTRAIALDAKLRVIGIIANLEDEKSNEYCKDLWEFLDDEEVWTEQIELCMLRHLVEVLVGKGMVDEVTRLLSRVRNKFEDQKEFVYWKMGCVFHDCGRDEEALLYYKLVLEINPVNDMVKSCIHSIYVKQGNAEMARRYETIKQLIEIVDGKNKYGEAYSVEKCMDMRVLYELTKGLKEEPERFIESNQVLVNDFLKNKRVYERRKKSKSMMTKICKPRRIGREIEQNKKESESVRVDDVHEGFRLADLHGLNVDEWFDVVSGHICSLLIAGRFEEATAMVFKGLEAHVFRCRNDLMIKLVFIGLKISLVLGDFGDFVTLVRSLICHTGNYSYTYLLFYFSNFFMFFHKDGDFSYFQKYLQRVCRRRLMISNTEYSSSDEEDINDVNVDKKEEIGERECLRRNVVGVTHFLFLNSLVPNLLQAKTVEMVSSIERESSPSESIILASMFLMHSKSRRVSDRNMFVKKGVAILKDLRERCIAEGGGDDACIASYNIGKAYQFFGFPGLAERFYLEALNASDVELKRLAEFNLYLIYKKSNTMQVFRDAVCR
ncbi:hypothetical protein CWI42_090820 [Ordospora colligata]|uniref:Uncharacterized protein n=1 Tax=Ordospora colligata OC4 TaxID=1354746 RepID=A0A0B2UDL9_9MICR|nr:uncharacterized protein M896_090820 [Ordospora colligata OC4]KHN69156.1 hypothetical protein M896_090820 [Ordospora colligata OC4]TBU14611.1 hypothetical protein CWI41_090820 [Ordospora colligata]TBU18128.1 hypothetical protein CWI42_090820 [Ordospora colligata]